MVYKVWLPRGLEGVEASDFRAKNQLFAPSLVTEFNFGVRLEGVREMTYRKRRFTTGPGTLHAFAPGVALTAKPVSGDAWRYVDVRFTQAGLTRLLGEKLPGFDTLGLTGAVGTERNDTLRERFLLSHAAITAHAPRLEQETKLLAWLEPLFENELTENPKDGREHRAIKLVKDYLHTHAAQDVGLDDLGEVAGLSKTYLLRVFKREVGLTPYRYQMGLRLARAKALLRRGMPLSQVAVEVGLYDQSALNRLFKRHFFITPGKYQAVVQLNRS